MLLTDQTLDRSRLKVLSGTLSIKNTAECQRVADCPLRDARGFEEAPGSDEDDAVGEPRLAARRRADNRDLIRAARLG